MVQTRVVLNDLILDVSFLYVFSVLHIVFLWFTMYTQWDDLVYSWCGRS
jgi:hypothetical protein